MFIKHRYRILNVTSTCPQTVRNWMHEHILSIAIFKVIFIISMSYKNVVFNFSFNILHCWSSYRSSIFTVHRAFTGEYLDNKRSGIYKCVVCGEDLFDSKTKYESGCGWPSFYDNLDKEKIKKIKDTSFGMMRTEVVCAKVSSVIAVGTAQVR